MLNVARVVNDVAFVALQCLSDCVPVLCCLQVGSSAEHAGLCVGDALVKVNGDGVANASCERVNGVLKKAGKFVQLSVMRRAVESELDNSAKATRCEASSNDVPTPTANGSAAKQNQKRISVQLDAALHDGLNAVKRFSMFAQTRKSTKTHENDAASLTDKKASAKNNTAAKRDSCLVVVDDANALNMPVGVERDKAQTDVHARQDEGEAQQRSNEEVQRAASPSRTGEVTCSMCGDEHEAATARELVDRKLKRTANHRFAIAMDSVRDNDA